ncbi:unnamed protein product [Sphagnum balticum]
MDDASFRQRVFYCFAEKIFNMNIRPSKAMDNCIFGNKFMESVLTNRLKLGEEEKACWKKYLKAIAKIEDNSEHGFYVLFAWPLQPLRDIEEIMREKKIKTQIDIYFGDEDWMSKDGAKRLAVDFENIKVHEIKNAGHQLIFDNPLAIAENIKLVHGIVEA